MARDIDRKLRLTAALLGAVTLKDLAAAFRRANAATSFDVERAHKWMQGRSRPREVRIYEDWAKLLDLGRPAQWVADSDFEAFSEAIRSHHQVDPVVLRRRGDPMGTAARSPEHDPLVGTYACYSHAWSPYFRGRVIRGCLTIQTAPLRRALQATYSEILPTGDLRLDGAITTTSRVLQLDLRQADGDAQFGFFLFPSSPPVSALGGFMCGTTIIGPDPQPSVTRIAIVRLPRSSAIPRDAEAYLPDGGSIAADLKALGLPITDPGAIDRCMAEFLVASGGSGPDQIRTLGYRNLVALFDREWLEAHKAGSVDVGA